MDKRELCDVHGSCVSFSTIKRDTEYAKWYSSVFKNNLFFSHVNHFGCVTKKLPALPGETDFDSEIVNNHVKRNIIVDLNKNVIELLKQSEAKWLLLDLYDSARVQWFYHGGWYTHVSRLEIVAPEYWNKIKEQIIGRAKLDTVSEDILIQNIRCYMDAVVEKYGIDHIILNRTALSRFWINENHELVEFSEDTDYLGSWRDNKRIRHLEDIILRYYPIASVDISKFFLADWANNHDSLSVHYEMEYYECTDRAYERIIKGESKCVNQIDEVSFAYKLDRDMTTRDGKDNWINYISAAICTEFSVNPLMDQLIKDFSVEELCKYRHELACIYRWINQERDYFYDDSISVSERQLKLVERFESLIQ
ncbi:MAG: hypothetical protein E7241_10220 [Lachnospiraceae bacterium]|nr:hypothetical protein [Lachnospiraceae bacterium]